MNKETIVFFSGYHAPHLGGIERYTDNLSKELVKKGYKVIIVTSNYNNLKEIEKNKEVTIMRIPIYNIFKNRYPIPKHNKKQKEILKKLDNYKIKAIIVNTRFHLTSLIGAKYGKKHNIPVFEIEHGSQHLTVDNKILDFLGLIYEHALTHHIKKYFSYCYGVSNEAAKWLQHFKIKPAGVWYNSIKKFGENIPLEKNKKIIQITYAGRILKQKGIKELINTFKSINNNNIRLNIAGDGNLLSVLKNNNNDKRIIFLGKLSFEKLVKLYAKTDIFVYAPIWPEGLPTAILEAGYMKCAVIASPFGGTKEIIKDKENGLMVTNEHEMYDALNTLIDNQKLREKYSNKLYDTVNKKFLWEKTCEKIVSDIEKNE